MSETITSADPIKALTETVRGRVVDASDSDARAVHNTMHDCPPRAVVQCTDAADVMAVLAAARDSSVDLAFRGGGHSVRGFGKSFAPVVVGTGPDRADDEANTAWVRDYYAAIHPHSRSEGGYSTFLSGDDEHRAADNYGADCERPCAVRAAHDPDNLFHVNQNIAPADGR